MGKTTVAANMKREKRVIAKNGKVYAVPPHISPFLVTRNPEQYSEYEVKKGSDQIV